MTLLSSSPMSAIAMTVACSALLAAQAPAGPAADSRVPEVQIAIASPAPDTYLTGATQLKAVITPVTAAASVSFFIDGREVCAISNPPFQCDWDAGRAVKARQVRMAVTFKDGRREAKVLWSKGLDFVGTTEVDAVQVTVTITNDGKFVSGLPQNVFKVWEDNKPQTINSFISENVPLELIVAVDVSASMADAMPKLKAAVKDFLVAIPPANEVTVLGFNDSIIPVARKATDLAERLKAVDRLSPWGPTALYDVIAESIEMLGGQTGRKAVIVFTDGEDQGSHLTIEEVEQRLQASDVTLYMIGQGRGVSAQPLQKLMHRLADPTGGRTLTTDSIDKLHVAFGDVLEELSHQYLVGYQSSNSARDGSWRELRVEVERAGRVRARKGYRASLSK